MNTTTETVQHTPTPLRLKSDDSNSVTAESAAFYWIIESGKGYHQMREGVHSERTGFRLSGWMHKDEAEFIVRACNNHEALLARMEQVLPYLQKMEADGVETAKPVAVMIRQVEETLQAAKADHANLQ